MSSPHRTALAALLTALALVTAGPAAASPEADTASRLASRISDPTTPQRGAEGATSTTLSTRPFRIDGSPYEWTFEVSQYRSGPGVPPDDPNLRIVAARRASTGNRPFQVHAWEFDLPAGAFEFNGELRNVGVDTGLIPAYGAIFMDLEDPSAMSSSKARCPSSGDVLSRRDTRKGVLRGSTTFFPGYDDPQMPDDVNIGHVKARIDRTRYTGAGCSYPNRCSPGKSVSAVEPTGPGVGHLVNAGSAGREEGLVFQQYEVVGVATVMHLLLATGAEDVLDATPTTVEIRGDVAAPFVAPGGIMSWTKGAKSIEVTSRCRRTAWTLMAPSGSFDLRLDSGDQTIAAPATAGYEVEKRR
jgi:hypothetical protein